jgi:Protein of unknown function (DUF3617)
VSGQVQRIAFSAGSVIVVVLALAAFRRDRSKLVAMAEIPMANVGDPPGVREGLWAVRTQSTDNPGDRRSGGIYTLCRNHAFDQAVQALAKKMKGCTKISDGARGNRYSSEMHCVIGGTAIASKGTTTFQGDTAFHSETHATYTPAMNGKSESTMLIDQRYLGSCPVGTLAGDRTDADGRITHLWKH